MDKISLWKIFAVFSKIGAFTIGGGYAMIPVIEEEMKKRKWICDDELPEIVTLAQSAPGLLAVNMAIYAGYRIRGLKGSIAATAGAVMPSFIIILAIAMFFTNFNDSPVVERIFRAVRPVAVALIAVPAVRMAVKGNGTWWKWAITLGTLMAVCLLKVSPIWIMLVLIVGGAALSYYIERRNRK